METKIANYNYNAYVRAFEILSEFEEKVKPFSLMYKSFPVWLGIRQYVYMYIVKILDPHIAADFGSGVLNVNESLSYAHLLINKAKFINRSLILKSKITKDKCLIFSAEVCRRAIIDGESINIFIDPIRMADGDNEIIGVEKLSLNNSGYHKEMFYTLKQYDLLVLQGLSFACEKVRSLFLRVPLKLDNPSLAEIIKNSDDILLERDFIYKLINNFIIYLELLMHYWKIVFKIVQPKLVVATDWYSRANMIMFFIANKMGIPTIEVLHGLINKYHTGYVFRNLLISQEFEYAFPNNLIVFGKLSKDILMKEGTLWKENAIFDLGYPWLDYSLNKLTVDKAGLKAKLNIKNGIKVLTITSQYTLQDDLKNILFNLKIPQDWLVVIKIHPLETISYKKIYRHFLNMPRIKFVSDGDIPFYDLLKISDAHASFYSTTLWEASAFGISNYIIDHSAKDLVSELESLGVAKISSVQDIFSDSYIPNKKVVDYIFSNLDGNSNKRFIDFFRKIKNSHIS